MKVKGLSVGWIALGWLVGLGTLGLIVSFDPPRLQAQNKAPGEAWTCSLDNLGATLTLCHDRAEVGQRLWITDIIARSTTSTAGLMLLQYGTGTNCGTNTLSLLPSSASAVRLAYPATTSPPLVIRLATPIAPPTGKDLCVLATGTNTASLQIIGYVAP